MLQLFSYHVMFITFLHVLIFPLIKNFHLGKKDPRDIHLNHRVLDLILWSTCWRNSCWLVVKHVNSIPSTCKTIRIDVRPKCIDDLEKPNRSYLVAIVLSMRYKRYLTILSAKPILFEHDKNKKRQTIYASLDKHDHKYSYMEGLEL